MRLCSQFLGPGDLLFFFLFFVQSYGAIFTDRAATGSGNLVDQVSTAKIQENITAYFHSVYYTVVI
jgi:hypothetical protein